MIKKKGEASIPDFESFIKYIKSLDPKTPIFDW